MTLVAILAVSLLLPAAFSDTITWEKCQHKSDILRVLGPLPDYNATNLALERCNITDLKPGDFDGLPNVIGITLTDNKIEHIDPSVFTSVNGLKGLHLYNNRLTEVPRFWELSLFPNMTTINLSKNQIIKLGPKTFSSMHSLQRLSIDSNVISYIHPDVFKNLTELEIISLHHNNLTNIPDGMFHVNSLTFWPPDPVRQDAHSHARANFK